MEASYTNVINQPLTTLIIVLILPMTLYASNLPPQQFTPQKIIQYTHEQLCKDESVSFPVIETSPIESRGRTIGQRIRYQVNQVGELQVDRIEFLERKPSYRLTYLRDKKLPEVFVSTDHNCSIRVVRRILYSGKTALSLQILEADLITVTKEEAIKPPVPEGVDSNGVRVGIVDSGVNYQLSEIVRHLARDPEGKIVGYDFWDLDAEPFDYNPARSVFFPQRHGTRTASLLLKEAPGISLVPYRYPRPDMDRMGKLVEHASQNGVKIIAMPLGSKNQEEWSAFFLAAEIYSEILFIVSSGNNGVNIDEQAIYPASFNLDNLLVVSSADEMPRPASRTNWGQKSTHILLPADRQKATDFNGEPKVVSGTSYAVSRIAALAARFVKRNPNWTTQQIKTAILEMTDSSIAREFTMHGLQSDPLADTAQINSLSALKVQSDKNYTRLSLQLDLNLVLLNGSGWTVKQATQAGKQAIDIYSSCNINLAITLTQLDVSDYLKDFHSLTSRTLIDKTEITTPTIYLVRDTLRVEAFGGEAFGVRNSKNLPWLRNTAWLIAGQEDSGIVLAHELFHILVDNGDHSSKSGNLMNRDTEKQNTLLTTTQCKALGLSKLFQSPG